MRSAGAPIVFLDIDGVICTRKAAGWPAGRPRMSAAAGAAFVQVRTCVRRNTRPARAIDPDAIKRLNRLCAATGALTVVSSSWRLRVDVPATLSRHGFEGAFHRDWKTDALGPSRGHEVDRWLARHGAPAYVILDDWPDFHAHQQQRVVRTNSYDGFQFAHLDQALAKLSGAKP